MTPREAAAGLEIAKTLIVRNVLQTLDRSGDMLKRHVILRFDRKGPDPFLDPPNPPPGPLAMRTGGLARSVYVKPAVYTEGNFTLHLGASHPAARAHEFGAVTSPHEIVPVRRLALRFFVGGTAVFSKHVNHPGSHIPPRPFLRPTVAADLPRIKEDVATSCKRALVEALRRG